MNKSNLCQEPYYWDEACDFLSSNDEILSKIIEKHQGLKLTRKYSAFHTLARSIVGQQISVTAADSIWLRIEKLVNCKSNLHYNDVLNIDFDELRKCGLSNSKANYIVNIAKFFEENYPEQNFLETDHDVIEKDLLSIKGVGRWTLDMFMLFHVHHPDILPLGDIGLLKSVRDNYGIDKKTPYSEMKPITTEIAKKWRPYSTVATLYLWKDIDPVVVEY
jgi:DNA-3-methyladenine glycosylase II